MPASNGEANVLDQITAPLKFGLGDRLVAIALFGLRARGDANPESDRGVLVIAEAIWG